MSKGENPQLSQTIPEVDEVKTKGRLVRSDERYRIYDYIHDGVTFSVTELKPQRETRGHSHDDVEEYYFFKAGKGQLTIGSKVNEVDASAMTRSQLTFKVPKGEFHKVSNTSHGVLTFLATFAGSRDDLNTIYASDGGLRRYAGPSERSGHRREERSRSDEK